MGLRGLSCTEVSMADMDDFAAFMADIQTAEAVVGTGDEAKDAEAGDKRPRGEDRA